MKNKINLIMILTTVVCLLPIILSIILYSQLPMEIPIHFDSSGEADNYLPKAIACFGLPVALALFNLFVHFAIDADPKNNNIAKAIKIIVKWIVPIISVICIPICLFISLDKDIPINIIVPALTGVLIIVCANYLPKSRQNYTVGVRIPWTFNNDNNWNKTHRLAGILWMIGGFIILITSLLQFESIVILIVISIMIAVPFVYSFVLYKKE